MRNGFALWMASEEEFGDIGEFARALAEAPLSDETEGTLRRITFGAGEDSASLEYDLREMWP